MCGDILDSLRVQEGRILLKEHHIDRTWEALRFAGRAFRRDEVAAVYGRFEAAQAHTSGCWRLVFPAGGPLEPRYEPRALNPLPEPVRLWPVAVSDPALAPPRSHYKWGDRTSWQTLLDRRPAGADDVLTLTADGRLRETSRFNIFALHRTSQTFTTPPLSAGCLNGVYRRHVLSRGHVELPGQAAVPVAEDDLRLQDLSQYDLYVGNSLRGLIRAIALI